MADVSDERKRKREPRSARVLMYLPPGVRIPDFYTKESDAQKISDALRVGATAVESSLADMSSVIHERALASERESMVLQQELLHQKALTDLEDSLTRKSAQLSLGLELELKRARMQSDELQSRLERERAVAESERERERAFFQNQLSAMQAAMTNVQQEREFSKQQLALSQRAADRSVHNSSVKGAEGEMDVERVIRNAFSLCPGFSMINESKQTGRGDRLTTIMGLKVMWEIKSHAALRDNSAATGVKRKVEKKDVIKLQENAASGLDFHVCVMIATHAKITGHDKFPVESEYAGRVLIIYVNQLFESTTPPIDILQWHVGCLLSAHAKLKEVTEIATIVDDADDARVGEDLHEMQAKLRDQIAAYVADAGKQQAERRRLLVKHQSLISASIGELFEEHRRTEITAQEGLTRLLQQARTIK
jgi:hypothetical protein